MTSRFEVGVWRGCFPIRAFYDKWLQLSPSPPTVWATTGRPTGISITRLPNRWSI